VAYREMAMGFKSRQPEPAQQMGDHIVAIIAKSIGIAAVLVGAVWALTAIAFRYF